jgi:hypothetical protein
MRASAPSSMLVRAAPGDTAVVQFWGPTVTCLPPCGSPGTDSADAAAVAVAVAVAVCPGFCCQATWVGCFTGVWGWMLAVVCGVVQVPVVCVSVVLLMGVVSA